jgi:hypothetical protein
MVRRYKQYSIFLSGRFVCTVFATRIEEEGDLVRFFYGNEYTVALSRSPVDHVTYSEFVRSPAVEA